MASPDQDKPTRPVVREGIPAPAPLNPHLREQAAARRRALPPPAVLVERILTGDRVALSRAITLVESTQPAHQDLAQAVIEGCLPHAGRSIRIGVTGAPGVGKSTFIEALGQHLTGQGLRLAVLAIDPSSQITGGSILGDKTRMARLSTDPNAFIRPSPAGDSLGGVAQKTRETIVLCEAAGFDTLLIETVGVGQSETAVHAMTDFFLLLLLPGAGDELQGIKRGIVEMADLIAVNKADGDRVVPAKQAQAAYRNALHLFPPKESQWVPQVLTASALSGAGVAEIWQLVNDYRNFTEQSTYFAQHRQEQALFWLQTAIDQGLQARFQAHPGVKAARAELAAAVLQGRCSPFKAAQTLLDISGGQG